MGASAMQGAGMPLPVGAVKVSDAFWKVEQDLVRETVIPYQWDALNDRVPGAEPSYCMHNFRVAGKLRERAEQPDFVPPSYTDRGFQALPEDPEHPRDDRFYGFVFQDSDFAKWIEAVGYTLAQREDPQLERIADEAIDVVCAAQLDDGYLDTYYIINGMDRAFTNLQDHHELYCFGHLAEGAVAYYEATGKRCLLDAACRFADCIARKFGREPGQLRGYPGHEIAEMALIRLAEATGEERYERLTEYFVTERGREPHIFEGQARERARWEGRGDAKPAERADHYAYYQAHKPVLEQDEAVGHAVRAAYYYSGVADVARVRADAELAQAAKRLWRSIVDSKLYVTGGIGGTHIGEAFSHPYDLPNDTAYSETCAAIALAFFARRMVQLEAKSEYADVMELALYNTVLAGMALDGKSFFYVNPLEVVPESCHRDERKFHVKPVRQKWFGCACCPPNIARLVSSIQQYAYTQRDDALYTHLYMGGTIATIMHDIPVTLTMESGMPWSGKGQMTVALGQSDSCDMMLAFRLPGWAGADAERSIVATGEREGRIVRRVQGGYVYYQGSWYEGDVVQFDFAMPVRMVQAHSAVREDCGKVAFLRGPVAYCAESVDNGNDLHLLRVDADAVGGQAQGVDVEITDVAFGASGMDDRGLGEVDDTVRTMALLRVPGCRIAADGPTALDGGVEPLYHTYRRPECAPVSITMIPYCAWANRGESEMRVFLDVR